MEEGERIMGMEIRPVYAGGVDGVAGDEHGQRSGGMDARQGGLDTQREAGALLEVRI